MPFSGKLMHNCICSPRGRSGTTQNNLSCLSHQSQSQKSSSRKQTCTTTYFNACKDSSQTQPSNTSAQVESSPSTETRCSGTLMTIYYQNVRGLRTKQQQLIRNSSSVDYSVIALTETWLNSSFFSSEYFDHTFIVYRVDRESTGATAELGGGTLIAVRDTLTSSEFKLQGFNDIEHICVKIRSNTISNIFVYVAYLPPPPSSELFARHLAAISSIPVGQSDSIIILGVFQYSSRRLDRLQRCRIR